MQYFVYILANQYDTTIYVGVTNDLIRRVHEHRSNFDKRSFTSRYRVHKLVYYEDTGSIEAAIAREKQIKSWSRNRKNQLIAMKNPQWRDLYEEIL